MQTREETRLSLSVILLSLVWPAAGHLGSGPSIPLAAVLAVLGSLLLAVSAASAEGGVALLVAEGRRRSARRIAFSLAVPALVLAVCGLSLWQLADVGWRLHDLKIAVPDWLAGQLGGGASGAGLLSLWTGAHSEDVRLTIEGLGLHQVWFLLVALVTLAWASVSPLGLRARLRRAAVTLAVIAGYAVIRYACLVVLATEFDKPALLWAQPCVTLSWLPLALVLRAPPPPYLSLQGQPATGGGSSSPQGQPAMPSGPRLAASMILLAAGFALAFAAWFNDPGLAKRGRILIDESRSDWEWTREPFDTTSFGIRAEYNYYCLREYLSHIYDVRISECPLSDALLDSADVLVIKTPTAAYGEPEIETIVRFVEAGGGLLLIGDHTNLFGMSTYLNSIASRFGMRFRFDDTFDLETTGLSTYDRPRGWFHPAVRNLARLGFLTSCSIEGGLGVEPVIVGYGLGSEDTDYGHPNFFGNIAYDLADRFGAFLQAGAKRHGRGRVLLFTDSTCFSNFCMFSPGKPEILLGFIDYLNRRGARYPGVRAGALALAGVLVGLAGLAGPAAPRLGGLRLEPLGHRVAGLLVLAGFAIGAVATARLSAHVYGPVPEPALPIVLFDTRHSAASFFEYLGEHPGHRGQQFAEFYISVRRLGFYPSAGTLGDLRPGRKPTPLAVVIINPSQPFSPREVADLGTYVRKGGRLLLLDSVTNSGSTANQVLGALGMEAVVVAAETGDHGVRPVAAVAGAQSSRRLSHLGMEVFTKSFGKGRVVVAVDAFALSAAVLGTPLERTHQARQRAGAFSDAFDLLRRALRD